MSAARLVRDLVAAAPGRAALAALLLLTTGVTEAFGLLMIVPLLQVAGVTDAGGASGTVVGAVASAAGRLGVPLSLPWVLGVFLALAAIRAGAGWARNVVTTRLRLEFTDGMRREAYAAVAGASWAYLVGRRRSDVQQMLTQEVDRVGSAAFVLVHMAVAGTLAAIQLAVAVAVAPAVGALAALLGLALAAAGRPLTRRPQKLGERLTEVGRLLRGHATDFLDGLKVAKVHNDEAAHVGRIERAIDDVREREIAFVKFSGATRAVLQFAAAAALTLLVWYAVSGAGLTSAELLLLALVFARVTPAALNLLQQAQQVAHSLPAYDTVLRLRDELEEAAEPEALAEPEEAARRPARAHRTIQGAASVGVEARDVTFEYPGAAAPTLDGVSFHVPPQGLFVMTGRSGSGKSTLAALLLGLLEPTRGEILVGGEPLRGTKARQWRNSTAFVAEDPFLLHESIRTNLSWGRPEATEDEMWDALRLVAAADFVAALPLGLDTVVGDRGERLSGGERQRIALAAALLREPALLVLDEPTGHLDPDTEARVIETLRGLRGRATMVVIAHEGPLLRAADRLLTLRSGRVVGAGGGWNHVAGRLGNAE